LKGCRGSAVSIALLRDGRPVLGVVTAFASPHGGEDMFAWAEGEPLSRKGNVVVRAPGAAGRSTENTGVGSQSADRHSLPNLNCVAPARFRALPSIAYRLALAACGEAEVGVSLSGPVDWDYAGGHALLLATGGDLFDVRGRPIHYSVDGTSRCDGR